MVSILAWRHRHKIQEMSYYLLEQFLWIAFSGIFSPQITIWFSNNCVSGYLYIEQAGSKIEPVGLPALLFPYG